MKQVGSRPWSRRGEGEGGDDTKEVGGVPAVAEPACGLPAGIVDAIVGEVGLEERQVEVVVVADVRERVPKCVHRWSYLAM